MDGHEPEEDGQELDRENVDVNGVEEGEDDGRDQPTGHPRAVCPTCGKDGSALEWNGSVLSCTSCGTVVEEVAVSYAADRGGDGDEGDGRNNRGHYVPLNALSGNYYWAMQNVDRIANTLGLAPPDVAQCKQMVTHAVESRWSEKARTWSIIGAVFLVHCRTHRYPVSSVRIAHIMGCRPMELFRRCTEITLPRSNVNGSSSAQTASSDNVGVNLAGGHAKLVLPLVVRAEEIVQKAFRRIFPDGSGDEIVDTAVRICVVGRHEWVTEGRNPHAVAAGALLCAMDLHGGDFSKMEDLVVLHCECTKTQAKNYRTGLRDALLSACDRMLGKSNAQASGPSAQSTTKKSKQSLQLRQAFVLQHLQYLSMLEEAGVNSTVPVAFAQAGQQEAKQPSPSRKREATWDPVEIVDGAPVPDMTDEEAAQYLRSDAEVALMQRLQGGVQDKRRR